MKTITRRGGTTFVVAAALATVAALAGCKPPTDLTLPSAEDVEGYYESGSVLEVEIKGNVAQIHVAQNAQQLRHGGILWAKVGPYVFLFTEETQRLFTDFPGLAGVRVTTKVGDAEVASALLARDELSNVLWRRGLNVAGRARRDGTKQVTLLENLVTWGEAHTEFEYNPRFTRR